MAKRVMHKKNEIHYCYIRVDIIFSSPGQSPERAIVLPPASALTAVSAFAKC